MLQEPGSKVFTDKEYFPLFKKSQCDTRNPRDFCITFDQRLQYIFFKTPQYSCFREN